MSLPRRVLRFRPAGSDVCLLPDATALLNVFLDQDATSGGQIVFSTTGAAPRWSYVLRDTRSICLQSTLSRQELESRILEFYFEDLVADRRCSA
ncbi:MAG: hypothetical protein ACHQ4G_04330 [Opitutales bacterium]